MPRRTGRLQQLPSRTSSVSYELDVIQIPTNRPIQRIDEVDSVFKSEKLKYSAVLKAVKEANDKGQPVLVGTVNVDKSEFLSRAFTKYGIKHNVLNAKNHMREAEIVAQAGRKGAVTIATNMAGRGTDILLGGNAEFMAKQEMKRLGYEDEMIEASTAHNETDDELVLEARAKFAELEAKFKAEIEPEAEEVRKLGGLFIVGTERHESRRIDNQLKGRAGRQGDPGKSKFFLSLEDDLLRIFGGDRITGLADSWGVDEIQVKALGRMIDSAQKKLEAMQKGFSKREADDSISRLTVLGFTDEMPQLMQAADVVITKAGGVSLAECLECGANILIYHPLPGQEQGNTVFLHQEYGAAAVTDIRQLDDYLEREKKVSLSERLQRQKMRKQRYGHRAAAGRIAELTDKLRGR